MDAIWTTAVRFSCLEGQLLTSQKGGDPIISTLFLGIDVSQAENVVCALTAGRTIQARLRVLQPPG